MTRVFEGTSETNDIAEALGNALDAAKVGFPSDYVSWSLEFIRGESGGFAQVAHLRVGIAASVEPPAIAAYFEVHDVSEKPFVIKLTDPRRIDHARRVLDGTELERVHIQGRIVETAASYNPGWSFHLDPDTIDFFFASIELCDASADYIEEHVARGDGSPLFEGHWCPWASRLVREIGDIGNGA